MPGKKIAIIGAGLAGLSCAFFLNKRKKKSLLFEKEAEAGGLCRSVRKGGFTFDFSGHLLHFKSPRMLSLVKNLLGQNLIKHKRNASVYTFGRFIPYPFQAHFHLLPPRVRSECLTKFIRARSKPRARAGDNFLQWINSTFGEGIARSFLVPYNKKFWRVPLDTLSFRGIDKFVPVPSISDIMRNAQGESLRNIGYNAFFWYPRKGSISQLTKSFALVLGAISLNSRLEAIYPKEKILVLKGGRRYKYDKLVLTLPLPELARIIKGLPEEVSGWFKKLRWLSIFNVNFGLTAAAGIGQHWIYFPQPNVNFFRVGFYDRFSSGLVPSGKGSLYAEFSYLPGRSINKKRLVSSFRRDLHKVGILNGRAKIVTTLVNDIPYGYPIYDEHYRHARRRIIRYLKAKSIFPCGRYGSWQYLSMEDVIAQSERLAYSIL